MRVFVLPLLLLLLPASAAAQVYKCKGKSGETMYSEHPCDARAEPMKLREQAAATPANSASSADSQPAAAAAAAPAPAPAASGSPAEALEAERSCISTATASIYGSSNDRVGTLQQQMSSLNEQLAQATDAERSQALRQRMATFRQAISREHASAHTQMNTARRACIQQHRPEAAISR
ncbi:hypothetical protein ABB27_11370 [Stenotrophomonas terrae]|uniref:DUF4124 domain-containing protein n=1 Tax=Stenotrophomonas terrae TaxID=405446 RepID=A0A0R0CCQ4_9GAMM|nr:DUF4124 domain-containing protein [Stenotrophomonas terrae]KRG67061.1 hypothetical protein ABB27_11370 [Stenotrophomonas terrae]